MYVKDSLEDEVYSSSDSNSTQQSIPDENLICYEEGRVPFFKVMLLVKLAQMNIFVHK